MNRSLPDTNSSFIATYFKECFRVKEKNLPTVLSALLPMACAVVVWNQLCLGEILTLIVILYVNK